jgi:hypothetical protein
MKKILFGISLIVFSCSDNSRSNKEYDISLKSLENLNLRIFSEKCLELELNEIVIDQIDSTIILKNKCEKKTLGILAALRTYPDGEFRAKSIVKNDTIITYSINNFLGDYNMNFDEEITDSIFKVIEIKKDSSRKVKRTIRKIEFEIKTEKVGLKFINNYVEYCNKEYPKIGIIEWTFKQKNVTEKFKYELKKIIQESEKLDPELGLGFDPIFNAQDYPDEGFELEKIESNNLYIIVKGKNWNSFKSKMKMKFENGNWLVNGVGIINMNEKERN